MITRAKLTCVKVQEQFSAGTNEASQKTADQVTFETRYNNADNPEDNSFSKYTPSANFSMSLTNDALFGKFVEGKTYYFDISETE